MQWGHIKTLFILSFLILNVYLVSQFIDRQQEVGYLDNQELPIEDQLASEQITNEADPVDVTQLPYISVVQREISEDDMEKLESFEDQRWEVLGDNLIISEFEDPLALAPDMTEEGMEAAIQPRVLYGEEYTFWDWNEELDVIIFFQQKERTIYYNENGLLLLFLNENNEVTHYTQTVLGETEIQGDLVQLNKPSQVIGQLFLGNYLNRGDAVTEIKVGYYSRISADGIQVFAPTWKVTVNGERDHFVNAIEGFVYDSNEHEFLQNVMSENLVRMNLLEEDNELKESLMPLLETRLESYNRSETE